MSDATDWLAPADLEPANRRVIKPSPLPNLTTTATADNDDDDDSGASRSYMVSDLDPDVADYISQPQPSGGLEAQPDKLVPHDGTIVEGQTLTSDHIVWILAQNNARDISVFHAPTEFGRMDAEHYIIATGLGLRHVHSLKDAIVHAVKQTKVPGLSSAAVAGRWKTPHTRALGGDRPQRHCGSLNDSTRARSVQFGGTLTHGFTHEDLDDGLVDGA